ncbi:hypothetical protein [Bacillus timonensis]|uniref:hypothetical protein n=1 Tax=Bacillus timonensis TaxID=1033734 RepID=UPI0002882BDC|nr:hypothetical protein [Bacillus timonensis]
MKRYWKILTLCFVTVIVIGAFYINSSLAAEKVVIGIEKESGNEAEVEHLVINGDYTFDNMNQSLFITKDETINLSNQSLIQQLTRNTTESTYKRLIDKYGQFMRGKDFFQNGLYEDENLVAYASMEGNGDVSKNNYFDIEILDIKLDKTTSMKVDVPNEDKYSWIEIVDVQVVNNELKVIARGFRTGSGEDLNVYSIDLDKKVALDDTIYSSPEVKNGWSDIRVVEEYFSIEPKKYLLFQVYAHEMPENENEIESAVPSILADEIMIYNIETKQMKKLEINLEENGFGIDAYSIQDSTVYVPKQVPNGIEVHPYNIEKDSWGEKQFFPVKQPDKDKNPSYTKLMNGKIYIISSENGEYPLLINDLNTGESLYKGKLVVQNQKKDQKDYKLYIYDLND